MTVFSDLDTRQALLDGHVVCCPLRLENVNSSSIDLTLGEYFWRCDARPQGIFNPYDEDEVKRYFAGPFQAKPYASVHAKLAEGDVRYHTTWPLPGGYHRNARNDWKTSEHPFKGIPEDWPVIVLRPHERILAHSHEFVGIRGRGTSMLKARSSVGRIGMKVCDDAGWGDTGYINRWTWEMRNDNAESVIIPVGERMAQIVFFQTGPVENPYVGKYQGVNDLHDLIEAWTPQDMLPRSFKDERKPLLKPDADAYLNAIDDIAVLSTMALSP